MAGLIPTCLIWVGMEVAELKGVFHFFGKCFIQKNLTWNIARFYIENTCCTTRLSSLDYQNGFLFDVFYGNV